MKECPDIEHLMAYIDGLLDQKEEEKTANHIKKCPSCRKEYNSLLEMDKFLSKERIRHQLKQIIPKEWGCPDSYSLSEYFCGDLDDAEKMEWIKEHINTCKICAHKILQMERGVDDLLKEGPLQKKINWTSVFKEKANAAIEIFVDQAEHLGNIGKEFVAQLMLPTNIMELKPLLPTVEQGYGTKPYIEETAIDSRKKIDVHKVRIKTDHIGDGQISVNSQTGAIEVSIGSYPKNEQAKMKIILVSEDGQVLKEKAISKMKRHITFHTDLPGRYLLLIKIIDSSKDSMCYV